MKLAELIKPFVGETGGLIAALRAVQDAYGCLPESAEAAAAEAFNLTKAEVKGVISFYADFHRQPKGSSVVRLCVAEACQAAGARGLRDQLETKFALKLGETSASQDITLEPVYCLGLCSVGPAALVDDRLVARADCDRIDAALDRHKKRPG